jgi:ribosome biogenesis protein Nip4
MKDISMMRSIEQASIKEAIHIFAQLNRANEDALVMSRRDRELAETRRMVWAYLHDNTKLSLTFLGQLFNRHHSTVIAGLRVHKHNMDVFSNGKPINPLYVRKYEEGAQILDQMLHSYRQRNEGLNYRVVLYTNNPETLDKYEIVNYSRV